MSISASLGNALSGLTASARSAQLVSNNVANAMTDGYGRREITLASRDLGGAGAGVRVSGVTRVVDEGLLRDRRLADAALGLADGRAAFYEKLDSLIGEADSPYSLAGRSATFESSLMEAVSRPDSDARLQTVLTTAQSLVSGVRQISDGIQDQRLQADGDIASQVDILNRSLTQVQRLNADISRLNGSGNDVTALEDKRQQLIDGISRIVPVREIKQDDGKVALYTSGGAVLLDHTPREIGFSPVTMITPDMTRESGALSGLTIDGKSVKIDGSFAPLAGGTLSAAFDVRDTLAPSAQSDLDAFARDLIERFQSTDVDPSLADGDPGLFTDRGAAFDPLNEVGLAGRLEINALVDPAQEGELRRLRDGLGALVPGEVGNATILQSLSDAMSGRREISSGSSSGRAHTAGSMAADFMSRVSADLAVAERDGSYASAQQQSLKSLEQAGGVDTDQEMQKLLLIEQTYAANARVIQTIDSLIETLLRI